MEEGNVEQQQSWRVFIQQEAKTAIVIPARRQDCHDGLTSIHSEQAAVTQAADCQVRLTVVRKQHSRVKCQMPACIPADMTNLL